MSGVCGNLGENCHTWIIVRAVTYSGFSSPVLLMINTTATAVLFVQ